MGYYEELVDRTIALPIIDLFKGYGLTTEGEKIGPALFRPLKYDTPWIWSGHCQSRICGVWREIYFNRYGFISRNCFRCWKIVVRMNTLVELYKIYELQKQLAESDSKTYNGKCGAELRPYCLGKGRYAAFWYGSMRNNDGLTEARELAHDIRRRIRETEETRHLKVILKRGCTEMEKKAGPSNLWTYPDSLHDYEDELDRSFSIPDNNNEEQPKWLRDFIETQWFQHARNTYDPTLSQFVGNEPKAFGQLDTVDYIDTTPPIKSKYVKKGKTNDSEIKDSKQQAIHLI